jgi:tol-pal system protein YbgF
MQQYKPLLLAATVLLIIGATSPASGEKELIIKLQGEVLVLQRQVRDLQESFDKWQGQSTASLQRISDNSDSTVRDISSIEDSLKLVQASNASNLAGATAQLQRISEQLTKQSQNFSGINQQINDLKQSIQGFEQKLEAKEKSVTAIPQNSPDNLYFTAYSQFNKGDYESAITNFKAYLNTQSQSEESDDAIYYMAESLSSLARYNEALREYERILSEYPKGDKYTQALLKKGITFLHLERRAEGVSVLKSVISQSPGSQEASLAKNELSRLGEEYSSATSSTTSTTVPPQSKKRPM